MDLITERIEYSLPWYPKDQVLKKPNIYKWDEGGGRDKEQRKIGECIFIEGKSISGMKGYKLLREDFFEDVIFKMLNNHEQGSEY